MAKKQLTNCELNQVRKLMPVVTGILAANIEQFKYNFEVVRRILFIDSTITPVQFMEYLLTLTGNSDELIEQCKNDFK